MFKPCIIVPFNIMKTIMKSVYFSLAFSVEFLFVLTPFVLAVQVEAVKVEQVPNIDGDMSDPIWQSASPFIEFRMVEPQPNQQPTEKTELRILYDNAHLYIGVICFDSEPSRISANSMAHDSAGGSGGGSRGWATGIVPRFPATTSSES